MNEREIFQGALDHSDPAQRQTYLDQSCGTDAALRARIEALLASHVGASQFLNVPALEQLKPPADGRPHQTVDFSRASGANGNGGTDARGDDNSEDDPHAAPDLSFLPPSSKPGSIGTLGHYEILQVLGQGEFGIVFKAFDEKLQRVVAIKAMNPQLAATSPPRKRFLREARSVAAIKHENIVQVYSVEEQPLPYLVMEYIDGQTLQQKMDRSGPLELPEILHLGRQMASGLAAAHAQGLIHRDIKPGNILLEAGAEQKVKITDFGLARAADDASMTRTGLISGTPMYMAPEQAMGQTLDHRADLFSLGSVLYQMASGRPPFRASTTIAVLKRVADETPRPIQEILPEVPDWLCEIIAKLHAKQPEDRFQSAKELADLLTRCQANPPQSSRHAPRDEPSVLSTPQNANRSTSSDAAPQGTSRGAMTATLGTMNSDRRRPLLGWTLLGAGVMIALIAAIAVVLNRSDSPSVNALVVSTSQVTGERQPDVASAGGALSRTALVGRPAQLPGVKSWSIETAGHRGPIYAVAYSPDGGYVASAGLDGVVRVWEAASGKLHRMFLGHDDRVVSLDWSADSASLASAGKGDGKAFVWNVLKGTNKLVYNMPGEEIRSLGWANKMNHILVATRDGKINLVDVNSGKKTKTIQIGPITRLALSSDANLLAVSYDRELRIMDAADGQLLNTISADDDFFPFAWTADSSRLVIGTRSGTVSVWDPLGKKPLKTFGKNEPNSPWLFGLAWSPRAEFVVGYGARCEFWDPTVGESRGSQPQLGMINCAAFSPDGSSLVAAGDAASMEFYATNSHRQESVIQGHCVNVRGANWSPDGDEISVWCSYASENVSQISIVDAVDGRTKSRLKIDGSSQTWSPDSRELAVSIPDATVLFYDRTLRSPPRRLATMQENWVKVFYSPDLKRFATSDSNGSVKVWRNGSEELLFTLGGHRSEACVAWSPDGRWLTTVGAQESEIKVWDADTGGLLRKFPDKPPAADTSWMALSPDGGILATAPPHTVQILFFDPETGASLATADIPGGGWGGLWGADSRRLAVFCYGNKCRWLNVDDSHLEETITGYSSVTNSVSAAPDRHTMASPEGHALYIWDFASGQRHGTFVYLQNQQSVVIDAAGHFRASHPVVESKLRYVVDVDGAQETLTLEEFSKRFAWKNDGNLVNLTPVVSAAKMPRQQIGDKP